MTDFFLLSHIHKTHPTFQTIIEADAAESKCILLDAAKVPQSSKVTIPESELAVETLDASQKSSEETPVSIA